MDGGKGAEMLLEPEANIKSRQCLHAAQVKKSWEPGFIFNLNSFVMKETLSLQAPLPSYLVADAPERA